MLNNNAINWIDILGLASTFNNDGSMNISTQLGNNCDEPSPFGGDPPEPPATPEPPQPPQPPVPGGGNGGGGNGGGGNGGGAPLPTIPGAPEIEGAAMGFGTGLVASGLRLGTYAQGGLGVVAGIAA